MYVVCLIVKLLNACCGSPNSTIHLFVTTQISSKGSFLGIHIYLIKKKNLWCPCRYEVCQSGYLLSYCNLAFMYTHFNLSLGSFIAGGGEEGGSSALVAWVFHCWLLPGYHWAWLEPHNIPPPQEKYYLVNMWAVLIIIQAVLFSTYKVMA